MLLKNHLVKLFIFMLLMMFPACDQQTQDVSNLISQGSWTISNITSNSATPPPTALISTEVIFANGGVEMSGPCNQMGGFYEVDEAGKVTRAEVHMTLKDCNSMDEQEVALLQYFHESSQLSFDGEQLIMQSSQGEIHFIQNSE